MEKQPEIVNFVQEEKIYLNTNFLKISEEGIILEIQEHFIPLSQLKADINGCYISQDQLIKLGYWIQHYYCYRCQIRFQKVFIFGSPICPVCNKNDKVEHKSSEWN